MVEPEGVKVAYVTVEAEELLRLCVERYDASSDHISLAINGTIPNADMVGLVSGVKMSDPNNIGLERFDPNRPIYLESWSELFVLGCVTEWCNARLEKYHWKAGIGIESAYKKSDLHEKYLGDGIVACDELDARQIVQECKAQNLKGEQSDRKLQAEIIDRINAKLSKHAGDGPANKKLLAVSIFGNAGADNAFDFVEIYDRTLALQSAEIFTPVLCVVVEAATPVKARIYALHPRSSTAEEFVARSYEVNFNPA